MKNVLEAIKVLQDNYEKVVTSIWEEFPNIPKKHVKDLVRKMCLCHYRFYTPAFWRRNSVVAYRDGNVVVFNKKVKDRPVSYIAGVIAHESCHIMGMTHPPVRWWRPLRVVKKTEVYRIGYFVEDLVKEILCETQP